MAYATKVYLWNEVYRMKQKTFSLFRKKTVHLKSHFQMHKWPLCDTESVELWLWIAEKNIILFIQIPPPAVCKCVYKNVEILTRILK